MESWSLKDAESFHRHFGPTLKILRQLGMDAYSNSDEKSKRKKILKKLSFLAIVAGLLYGYIEFVWICEIWNTDKVELMLAVSNFLYTVSLISKGVQLQVLDEKIESILDEIALLWKNNKPIDVCYKKIHKEASKSLFLCQFIYSIMLSALVITGVQPFLNYSIYHLTRNGTTDTYDFSKVVFVSHYPFEITSTTMYFLLVLEEIWLTYYYCLWWSGSDFMFIQSTSHISHHFEILKYDIKNFFGKKLSETDVMRSLIIFTTRHKHLLRLCNNLQDLFGTNMFISITMSSMSLCLGINALKTLYSLGNYTDAIIFFIMLVLLTLHIFIYCTFSEMITIQSESISSAMYSCKWMGNNYRHKIFFQLLILKSQKPFYFRGCGFFRIGHIQFKKIVNGALSYYMFIRATS